MRTRSPSTLVKVVAAAAATVCLSVLLPPSAALGAALQTPDVLEVTEWLVIRWNPDSPATTYTRDTGTSLFGDLTRLYDGRYVAYRTDYQSQTPALFQIDPATGAATLLVQSNNAPRRVVAMAPMRDGNILAYENEFGWVSFNPATLAYTRPAIAASNAPITLSIGGMAVSPGGDMYAWGAGFEPSPSPSIFQRLYKVDVNAGTATAIGGYSGLAGAIPFNALAFAPDGRLFGFTEINGGGNGDMFQRNSIYQIDTQTGTATFVAQRPELANVRGAIFIPEPSGALLAALAAVPFVTRAARRRARAADSGHSQRQQ